MALFKPDVDRLYGSLFYETELPLQTVLAQMEYTGVSIDRTCLSRLQELFETQMTMLQDDIYTEAGGVFNIGSPKQLAEVLFEKMGLPVVKRPKRAVDRCECARKA